MRTLFRSGLSGRQRLANFAGSRLPPSFAVFAILGSVLSAMACTIPVFRFALDRWEADSYRLVVPVAWAEQSEILRLLVPLRGNGEANVTVVESDEPSLTAATLLFPHDDEPLWQGPLDSENLDPLLTSPGREELLRRLLEGTSAVWVVFTTESDRAEVDRIAKRLAFLEQVASLPVQDPNDPDSQLGPGPSLRLAFSVLPISLDDPAEKWFAKMAAGPGRADLVEKGISFAAPIFGRGRVLGSWPVAELDDTTIEDASLFLTGRCSCRVKNENPGWDIVLKVGWERALLAAEEAKANEASDPAAHEEGHKATEKEASKENASPAPVTKVTTPDPVVTEPAPRETSKSDLPVIPLVGVAIVLCLVGGFMLWYRR